MEKFLAQSFPGKVFFRKKYLRKGAGKSFGKKSFLAQSFPGKVFFRKKYLRKGAGKSFGKKSFRKVEREKICAEKVSPWKSFWQKERTVLKAEN